MPWPSKKTIDDSSKLFLKVDEIVKIQLLENEPQLYYTHYVNGKSVKCSAPDCQLCISGEKRNEKGSIKVVDLADGMAKALCGTSALFLSLKEALDMCGGKDNYVFSIKATGQKSQRRYHIVPLPLKPDFSAIVKKGFKEEDEKLPF